VNGQQVAGLATVITRKREVVVEEVEVPVILRVRGVAKRRAGITVVPAPNTNPRKGAQ
jgi:hypothetical protein